MSRRPPEVFERQFFLALLLCFPPAQGSVPATVPSGDQGQAQRWGSVRRPGPHTLWAQVEGRGDTWAHFHWPTVSADLDLGRGRAELEAGCSWPTDSLFRRSHQGAVFSLAPQRNEPIMVHSPRLGLGSWLATVWGAAWVHTATLTHGPRPVSGGPTAHVVRGDRGTLSVLMPLGWDGGWVTGEAGCLPGASY